MAQKAFDTARAYGAGAVDLRGGFCPYGSSAGGTAPVIPTMLAQDPTGNSRPRWAGIFVGHDGKQVGKYQVTLDDDYQDLIVIPELETNLQWRCATTFLASQTSGHGVTLFATSPGTAGNLLSVKYASASGSSTSCSISGNEITITPQTSDGHGTGGAADNGDVAAAVNADSATLGICASIGDTDLAPTGGSGEQFFTGGQGNDVGALASLFIASDSGSPDGVVYTARNPGYLGNLISIIYVFSGSSNATASVATGPNGVTITITIPTSTGSTTNATICHSVNNVAAVSAIISASWTGSGTDTNTTDTVNVKGSLLTGGGLPAVYQDGPVHPRALWESGITSMEVLNAYQKNALPTTDPFSHFALQVFLGDTPTDLNAQSQIFVPSATQGSGIMLNSMATAATQATASILSTSGAGYGIKYTATQPGDAGNTISVVYLNPQATVFIPSTTGGDGISFQANTAYAGQAGQQISVSMAAPNPSLTTCQVTVNGLAIAIYPQSGNSGGADTNSTVVTAIGNSTAASLLVTATATGGADLVTGNFNAKNLGGGYTQASATASCEITGSPTTGWLVAVQFGTNCTNTTVKNAVNAVATGPLAVVSAAIISSSGSDYVVARGATSLTGGMDTTDLSVLYVGSAVVGTGQGLPATLTALVAGNASTITVNSTTNFPSAGTLDILNSAGNVIQIAYTGTTSTTFTGCSGGSASYNFNSGVIAYLDTPVAVMVNDQCDVYLGYTGSNNTNAALALAINEAQAGNGNALMQACVIGTTTDLNSIQPSGRLSWGAQGGSGASQFSCDNLVRFIVHARNSPAIGP